VSQPKAQRPTVLALATTEQNWGLSPLSERKNTEPRDASEKAIALAVAVQAFGSGPESLLHRSIREDLGAAYSTSAVLTQLTPGVGLFVTTFQLDAEKAPAAIARLKAEYDDLMARGIDESQVKTVTEALKKAELDRPPLSRAVNLLQYEVRNLSIERLES